MDQQQQTGWYAVLRLSLSKALKWGLVARNVAEAVDRPTVRIFEITPLTPEQSVKFLEEALADRRFAMYVLALTTGLRQGELFGLQRDDIDLVAGKLTVRRTLLELNGDILIQPPKTDRSRRLIELPKAAILALERHEKQMEAEGLKDCVWVFPDTSGNPLRRQNVTRRSFRPIVTRAKLGKLRFHDLRPSCATLLLIAGVHPKIV